MKFGIDRLLEEPAVRKPLVGRRVALLAHPASVTAGLVHSLDALAAAGVKLTAAFGPQHGLRGDKQDNMVESEDFTDPVHGIPVFSLYGEVRRPTGQSLGTFDTIVIYDATYRMSIAYRTELYRRVFDRLRPGGTFILKDMDPGHRWKMKWARFQERISDRLWQHPEIDASNITVTVSGAVAGTQACSSCWGSPERSSR